MTDRHIPDGLVTGIHHAESLTKHHEGEGIDVTCQTKSDKTDSECTDWQLPELHAYADETVLWPALVVPAGSGAIIAGHADSGPLASH